MGFLLERTLYKQRASFTNTKNNTTILGSITIVGLKSLSGVILALTILGLFESYIRANTNILEPLSKEQIEFNINQLRLYESVLNSV